MITLSLRCWLWARKRLVRPGPACVQPSWGAFVRADLPREVVGRALGWREPAKMLRLSPAYRLDVVEGASSPSLSWLVAPRGAARDIGTVTMDGDTREFTRGCSCLSPRCAAPPGPHCAHAARLRAPRRGHGRTPTRAPAVVHDTHARGSQTHARLALLQCVRLPGNHL